MGDIFKSADENFANMCTDVNAVIDFNKEPSFLVTTNGIVLESIRYD